MYGVSYRRVGIRAVARLGFEPNWKFNDVGHGAPDLPHPFSPPSTMESQTTELNTNWRWKERDQSVVDVTSELELFRVDGSQSPWTKCHSMPSEVHVELMKAAKIPDPYKGHNEHQVQCAHWFRLCASSSSPHVL